MFERFARGWELMKQSWHVLQLDKELMLFPVFSTFACFLVMVSFALPIVLSPTLRDAAISTIQLEEGPNGQNGVQEPAEEQAPIQLDARHIVPAVVGFLFYLATSFVIIFFNTALVCCAMIRFSGGNPTIGDGLSAAAARLPQIFGWALLTATVGTILRAIEERVPMVGRLVLSLIGMAWAAVTFLIVPILAAEKVGPFVAVKRSASLLRKTWGEALIGQVSLGGIQFLFMLPALAGFIGAVVLTANMDSYWPLAIGSGIAIVYVVMLAIVFSTLQQIFLAAVYQYAAEGAVPAGFSRDLIESAFKRKGTK